MSFAEVHAKRAEVLKLRDHARAIQAAYMAKAEQRLAYQNKMAKLNEMIQLRAKDVMLVEDVVVVTLMAEKDALDRYAGSPDVPQSLAETIAEGQRTKDPNEALRIYNSQLDDLHAQIEYSSAMAMAERDIDDIYRKAVDEILDIMELYCGDPRLLSDVMRFAESGPAPSSPRKSPHKKGGVSKLLSAPSSMVFTAKPPVPDVDIIPASPNPGRRNSDKPQSPKKKIASLSDNFGGGFVALSPPLLGDDDDADHDNYASNPHPGSDEDEGSVDERGRPRDPPSYQKDMDHDEEVGDESDVDNNNDDDDEYVPHDHDEQYHDYEQEANYEGDSNIGYDIKDNPHHSDYDGHDSSTGSIELPDEDHDADEAVPIESPVEDEKGSILLDDPFTQGTIQASSIPTEDSVGTGKESSSSPPKEMKKKKSKQKDEEACADESTPASPETKKKKKKKKPVTEGTAEEVVADDSANPSTTKKKKKKVKAESTTAKEETPAEDTGATPVPKKKKRRKEWTRHTSKSLVMKTSPRRSLRRRKPKLTLKKMF